MSTLLLKYRMCIKAGKYSAAQSIYAEIMNTIENNQKYSEFRAKDRIIEIVTQYSI